MRTLLSILVFLFLSLPSFAQQEPHPEPMHVRVIDNIAHQGIQAQTGWAGPLGTEDIYRVPDDYILVIEFVSIMATSEIWDCRLTTTVKGTMCSHALIVHPAAKKGESGVVSQSVRIYADPGSVVQMWANTAPNNTGMATISGYLVHL